MASSIQAFSPSLTGKRPTNSLIDTNNVQKDFIEASFEPAVSVSRSSLRWLYISLTMPVDVRARHVRINRAIDMPWRTVDETIDVEHDGTLLIDEKGRCRVLGVCCDIVFPCRFDFFSLFVSLVFL